MNTLEKINNLHKELILLTNQELDKLETMDLIEVDRDNDDFLDHLWHLPMVYESYDNMRVPYYLAKVIKDDNSIYFIGWEVEDIRITRQFYRHDLDLETTIELLETVEYLKTSKIN